ncbi:hypothetical protein PIB30_043289 [Stylosanthes scabra]|uniref:Uncharacterized protein n=1 Tax=Stylosanthes scabra TaxID=79078 RepID=A0ABU6XDL8_9FABA|nr:hypothetical protein [Stylosanthes scabra]
MAFPLDSNGTEPQKYLKPEPDQQEEMDGFLIARQITISSAVVPMVLRTAIELGVFDIIAKAGEGAKLSAQDIVDQIGTNNPEAPTMLDRLLRLLASHSLLCCSVVEDPQNPTKFHRRLYGLSPTSKHFVTDADGFSLASMLSFHLDKVFYQSWSELKGAILEGGIPFNRAHGMHVFEYAKIDPRFNEVFNKAMVNTSTILMKRTLDLYKGFEHINKLVDVGGGVGNNLKLITSKYPHIHGINFDVPHVIEGAPTYTGVEHVAGDMFECVPNGDAIFIKRVLHDWSDEECLKILKNCYKAVPNDGKVIVMDMIIPIVPEPTAIVKDSFRSDVVMMTHMPGGIERSKQDFMDLANASGFNGIRFVCCVSSFWIMEFYK